MDAFNAAVAQMPQWVQIWMNILLLGAFAAPLSLLFWRQSRVAGIVAFVSSVLGATIIMSLFQVYGMVRLLGLGHILWFGTIWYLMGQRARADMPAWPKKIMLVIICVMAISLVFDTLDVIRWIAGDRAPIV